MRRPNPKAPKPRWILQPQPDAADLDTFSDYPPQLATLLWQRGFRNAEKIGRFLSPSFRERSDPRKLSDMRKAVARLRRALSEHERLFVVGDLDHDGICGAVLLVTFLEDLGLRAKAYIPSETEGHDVSARAIALAKKSGAALLFTVDFGVSSHEAIRGARQQSIDVVILDHHALPQTPPAAAALVDPRQDKDAGALANLCGAGVAFAFVDACLREGLVPKRAENREQYLHAFLDLVAMATVGDLVPLVGDNRLFVQGGLLALAERKRPGTKALLRVAGILGSIGEDDVAFSLVPRLNAASRVGNASLAYQLLTAKKMAVAQTYAKRIDRANRERQTTAKHLFQEATEKIEGEREIPWVIVVGDVSWPMGYLPVVVSRLRDRYHRPVFVWGGHPDGFVRMSARSLPALNLVEAMRACGGTALFRKFGGHPQAAGADLDAAKLSEFAQCIKQRGSALLSREDLVPRVEIDLELGAKELSPELARSFEPLAPFGKGNPRPRIVVHNLEVSSVFAPRRSFFGAVAFVPAEGGKTLRTFVEKDHPALQFRAGDVVDVVFEYVRLFGMSSDKTPLPVLVDAHLH